MKFNRKLLLLILVLAVVSTLLWAQERQEKKRGNILDDMDRLGEVIEKIFDYYVDEVDSEELINSAIEGMLGKLDPHSVYLDKHQYENLVIDTKGEFGGLGITISIRDDFPTVISPIEGTPAYRLGIQGGDRIVEIEGVSTNGWNSEKTVSKLRGAPGTKVDITVSREGLEDSLHYEIEREIITVPSIPFSDVINGVGYIRISRFAEKTAHDLEVVLAELEGEGIRGLILDIRSNPGGLLSSAREVSELFLEDGKLVVYTDSRIPDGSKKFYSRSKKTHDIFPLVLLVNGASASASEIVAGALQDMDRAVIVGQTTFGKGSVQTVFKIGDSSALKLTTQKYFTPSGRSIHKEEIAAQEDQVRSSDKVERQEYFTEAGRTVYGGGGITPDWELELPEFTELQRQLEARGLFFSFAVHFTAYNEVDRDFVVTDEIVNDFGEFIKEKGVEVGENEWNKENVDYIRTGVKREIFRKAFGTDGVYEVALAQDEELRKILEMFEKAPTIEEMFAYINAQKQLAEAAAK